jgi:putative transposase
VGSGIYNKYTGYHNRRSIRLDGYDYSRPGNYFITICIHDPEQRIFGDVVDGRMILNENGKYVERCWNNIPIHFPNVVLDESVVMPNHVHGIIVIGGSVNPVGVQNAGVQNIEPLQWEKNNRPFENRYQHIISCSIGSIIRGFKIGVTKWFREKMPGMVVWQRNFYEHIIRDDKSIYAIRKYIRENPVNWPGESKYHYNREFREIEVGVHS